MISKTSDACMCMPSHPQESYCNADYVIYAKLVGRRMINNNYGGRDTVYKLNIKKTFKMSEAAQMYLKKSTIITSSSESTCGIHLHMNKLYAIAARGHRLSLCDFVKEYSFLTPVQKRGFAVAYKHGCDCNFNFSSRKTSSKQSGSCVFDLDSCEDKFGVCIRRTNSISKCHWRPTNVYTKCKKREISAADNIENMA
jgi:metalloproteinase inhibitor 3